MAARSNPHHAKARPVIERAWGIMKARWRATFFKAIKVRPVSAAEVGRGLAVLFLLCYSFFLSHGGTIEPLEQTLERPEDRRHQPHLECEEHLPGAVSLRCWHQTSHLCSPAMTIIR